MQTLLALDLGTVTGWALLIEDSHIEADPLVLLDWARALGAGT